MDNQKNKKINNFGTKIASLFIAIFIWCFVTIFVNPEITTKYNNIPVIIQNSEVLDQKKLKVLTDMKDKVVSVNIKGKRTSISNLDRDDVTAYIDANSIKVGKKGYQIRFSLPYDDLSIASQTPNELRLNVEKIITKDILITLNKTGKNSKLRSCWLDDYWINAEGISSKVKQVAGAKVDFDIAGIKSSKSYNVGYVLTGSDGKELKITPKSIGLPETILVNTTVR